MATHQNRYYQIMMDAIASLASSVDETEFRQRLTSVAASFGYQHLCVIAAPSAFPRAFDDKLLLNGWPKGWLEQYRQSNFTSHDPVAAFLRQQTHAFVWSDVPIPDDRKARSVMDISSVDYKMRYGLCIPAHDVNGNYEAGLSFAGPEPVDVKDALEIVQMIGVFALGRLGAIRSINRPEKVLSSRECEVISWAAVGKTAWDTGSILNIAEDTVNKHFTSAMRKLNVHNKPHAVAESIRRGEIKL